MSLHIPNDPFTQRLQQISQWIAQGHLQQAAQALTQAQAQEPQDARIALLGMRLADQAGNPAGALKAAQRAVALAPGWHVALTELAALLARQGKAKEALPLARQAVAAAPQDLKVLRTAAGIADHADDKEQALTWAQTALGLAPDDVQLRAAYAGMLDRAGQFEQARAEYSKVLEVRPGDEEMLRGLFFCTLRLEDMDEARRLADVLIIRHPDDEQIRYWHAVAHGQTPKTQPDITVARLFDDYAERFDLHLVGGLKYHAPERVAQILLALHPDRRFNVLDLGCGTGLLGLYLGRLQGHLIGVDLSEKMIDAAARHGVYSRFHHVNILDALRDTPADHYEVITCLDALVYVGDLAPVIPNALRILKAGGHFIFTCEAANEDEADLVLRPNSNRYAHKASAVERQCREAGFDEVQFEHLESLRNEGGKALPGFIVIARKPLAAPADAPAAA